MTLELPRLDDRDFQSLVDEAKSLIPTYCPEWTNHNVGDPGVALIELFAYMTDITLYRVNQLPDRLYSMLLNLVGVERRPAVAAEADIQFRSAPLNPEPEGGHSLTIPRNTIVASEMAADGSEINFATTEAVVVTGADVQAFVVTADLQTDDPLTNDPLTNDIKRFGVEGDKVVCFPRSLRPGDAFYVGFDRSLARAIIQLDIEAEAEGTGIKPDEPPYKWEAFGGHWQACGKLDDTTGGLNRPGTIELQMPEFHERSSIGDHSFFWLRAILTPPSPDSGTYKSSPKLTNLKSTTVGVTVPSSHVETVVGPTLVGHSDGTPGQEFALLPNILRRDKHHRVEVRATAAQRVTWTEVDDFSSSEPEDRHVVWEQVDGRIRFGPTVAEERGRPRSLGKIPPKHAEIWVTGYRCGGGASGNVGEGHLRRLHEAIPGVESVRNLQARGGADAESIEVLKSRAPNWVRAGGRAVTGKDIASVALNKVESVARIHAAPPAEPGDPIRLLTVPAGDIDPRSLQIDELAITNAIVADIRRPLNEVRIIGMEIEVTTPYYQGVSIVVRVRPRHERDDAADLELQRRIEAALYRFVDPIKGGAHGEGWPYNTDLVGRDVSAVVEGVPGVHRVEDVALFEVDLRGGASKSGERIGSALNTVPLGSDSLFLSFQHRVVFDHDD